MRPSLFRLPERRSRILRYGVAALFVIAVTWLRAPLGSWLGNSVPFILYFPVIVVAGWFGGFGPAAFTTVLAGFFAKTWFFEPVGMFTINDWPSAFRLLVFLLSGLLISFLCGRLHRQSAELAKKNRELELKVRDRTAHLEQALQDMETFSLSISHDLRGPVRSMVGYSEILLEEQSASLPPDSRGFILRIHKAAQRLDQLIDDLLSFARISGTEVELEPVSIADAVHFVLETSLQLNGPGIQLQSEPGSFGVLAHRTLLHQVLKNLLENAAKFVPPNTEPRIRVWAEARAGNVRIWVVDNGIGIPHDQQKRLFRMFERLQPSSYAGTGVGLAIVERAVQKMKGRVGVDSEPGQGSRFWIELPAAVVSPPTSTPALAVH